MSILKNSIFLLFLCLNFWGYSQEAKVDITSFEGVLISGYVNQGAFINFTGPNITLTKKSSKFIVGMLPSLHLKKDISTPKNSIITPTLGFGFTYCYKIIGVQIPLYYFPKSIATNGSWHLGIGLGLRLNALNKNK